MSGPPSPIQTAPPQISPAQPPQLLWTANFVLIMAVNLLIFVSFQMLLPTMPLYVQRLGATEDIVGFIMGIFTVTSVGVRPLAGRFLDSLGRRSVYFFGLATIVVSIVAYDLFPILALVLLIRLVHGLGWGIASTAAGTIATDVIPRGRLGEGMGYYGLTTVLSMAVAPVLGLQIVASAGFGVLFYGSAAVCILGAGVAGFITYIPLARPAGSGSEPRSSLLERRAYVPSVLIFFINLTYGAIVAFVALYAAQFGIRNIGIFFTVFALALLVARPAFGRLVDRKGFDIAMIPGMLCIGLAMLTLYLAQGLPHFIVAAFLYGIGGGAVAPSLQAMAILDVPPQRRGAATGTFMSGFDLGIGVGAILWGLVAKFLGYSAMYLLNLTPVAVAFILYVVLAKKRLHRSG
jgi:MFS family permease